MGVRPRSYGTAANSRGNRFLSLSWSNRTRFWIAFKCWSAEGCMGCLAGIRRRSTLSTEHEQDDFQAKVSNTNLNKKYHNRINIGRPLAGRTITVQSFFRYVSLPHNLQYCKVCNAMGHYDWKVLVGWARSHSLGWKQQVYLILLPMGIVELTLSNLWA